MHILVFDQGRGVERGTHAELIGAGGRYWELLRRQQLEEELDADDAAGDEALTVSPEAP